MSQHLNHALRSLLAAAVAVLLTAPAALAASAPAAPAASTHPDAMDLAAHQAATAVPTDPRPFTAGAPLAVRRTATGQTGTQASGTSPARPLVFGYANAGNLGSASVGTSTWRFQDLSTVAFFGLTVASDGSLVSNGSMSVWNSQDLTNLINAAHPAGVKVVVSLIQHTQSTLCSSLANAQTTVTQTIAQLNAKGVDGVNIDYEGYQQSCSGTSGDTMASRLDNLAKLFRQDLPSGRNNLTIATYASSAYDTSGFFDIHGLAPYVNQFFVMAYDLDNDNWKAAPLNCTSYCFSPVGPLQGYSWTDQRVVSTYAAVVPKSQVILGVPYYGWYACVKSPVSNAYPVTCAQNAPTTNPPGPAAWVNPTYLSSLGVSSESDVSQYTTKYDAHDGSENYATWWSSYYGSWREEYIDNPNSLGSKYDLVTSSGIAGAGIFTLDYGGGDSGLWGSIEYHLTCPTTVNLPASVTSTRFQVTAAPAAGCARSVAVQEYDQTLNQGWFTLADGISPGSAVTVDTYPGHTYAFRARAYDIYGRTDDWTPVPPTFAVPANTPLAHPFAGLYTADQYGGVHGVDSAPLMASAYWPGKSLARSVVQLPGSAGGYVLDAYGALHPYGGAPAATISAYWPGWDIARDVQLLPDGTGGYVLDGWGALHPFAVGSNPMPSGATITAHWTGWDIGRGFVILPNGQGGYVLDAFGALHSFWIGSNGPPPSPQTSAYWPGYAIARGVALVPGTDTGYVLDGYGGIHPFNNAPMLTLTAYWSGWDIARALWLTTAGGQPEGYVLDGWGSVHPVGGMPGVTSCPSWPGQDIVKDLSGS